MKTGFGRNAREVLTRLYKAGFEVVEYAAGGIRDGDPQLKATPWKTRGVIPADDAKFAHLIGNESAMNAMSHGHIMIDQVLKEERPDVAIFVEDIWHIQGFMNKPWWGKIPCIVWTPIDSCPMMPVFREFKSKMPHLWVKAEFAKRELEKDGVSSIVIPDLIDQRPFRPLNAEQKAGLRRSCGLEDNFIVGFVFRNQVRKLVVTLLEAFKQFQELYPEAKGKILLHTNFFETAGWNIPHNIKELGVAPQDVLTTYICRKCKKVQVIPFQGNELNCGACGAEKSVVNTSIDFGVTEDELNSIYNLMDCYAHPVTSGGHEMPVEEAMLAGVPCGTVDYAFGETFIKGGAFPFKSVFYREHSSNFFKAQPTVESVLEFLVEAYTRREEYQIRGLEQRAWAQEYFSADKHAQTIIDIVSSFSETEYDFNFYDIKDVDFPPDYSIVDNADFMINLFSGIFGMDFDRYHPEVQKFAQKLEYQTRESIVQELKQLAHQHNENSKPITVADFVEASEKKKIIFVEPGGLQECFIAISVLEAMKNKYPIEEWDHYISCAPAYGHVFAHLDWVKRVVPYNKIFDQPFFLEGRGGNPGYFDIAFQPYLNPSWTHNGLA